jgi:hypothetical protein
LDLGEKGVYPSYTEMDEASLMGAGTSRKKAEKKRTVHFLISRQLNKDNNHEHPRIPSPRFH